MDDKLLETIIDQEVDNLLEEGLADVVKSAWQKTKGAASGAWDKVKSSLSAATKKITSFFNSVKQKIASAYPDALAQFQEIKAIEKETGETIPIEGSLKKAMQLPKLANAAKEEMLSQAQATQELAKSAPQQPQQQQQAQEALVKNYAYFLNESFMYPERFKQQQRKHLKEDRKLLKEVDPFGMAGLALGLVGGIPLLLKALYKLANKFKMKKTAEAVKSAYEVAHHIEEKVVDIAIPDTISYKWYKSRYEAVNKTNEGMLDFEAFKANTDGIKSKVEKKMYIILLIPFLFHGVSGMLQAGSAVIQAAEGAASAIKAIEIGQEVVELAGALAAASGD